MKEKENEQQYIKPERTATKENKQKTNRRETTNKTSQRYQPSSYQTDAIDR